MAQPAGSGFTAQDNRPDMGIPVFWASANSDPPWIFETGFDQFLLAVTVKENVDPEVMLEEPKIVLEEPLPVPEPPVQNEDAPAVAEREARNRLARDRVALENEERVSRGPKVGHNVFYHEVGRRLTSRLFLALGAEGKKKFIQKNPHTEIFKLNFRDIVRLAKISFEKTKCITYERYKLFTRSHETNETLESFYAALTAQAAKAELGGLEEELVRDLFISRMRNVVDQDTLAFETFSSEEVLKRALKFEQSKQTLQAFQKSSASTNNSGLVSNSQMKIKQEPVMAIGNKGYNPKRQGQHQNRRKQYENKNTQRSKGDQKQCTRCGRVFGEGHLKNCPAMGKSCKNCNKPNHFAKMCRSQQVNEIANEDSSSEAECNLIQNFDSCDEFEIMALEEDFTSIENVRKYINKRISENVLANVSEEKNNEMKLPTEKFDNIEKIESRRNPKSHQVKALKALVKIDSHILNMTIDTSSPVSLLNWATTKQILEGPKNSKFIPVEKLNLSAQFVDYNKRPILILGALKVNLRSADWEVLGAMLLVTERRMRCILGLDLQSKLGIQTTQKAAPTQKSRFDVPLCEQSEGWKQKFYKELKNLFDRQGESKNYTVYTKFKYPLCPIQEKGRRIPIHIQDKVQTELDKLLSEGHIEKLDKCTSDCFIAPNVITVKKDNSIKLALDAKPINRQLYKNKYQMPNVDELIDGVSQIITATSEGSLYFTVLDLKYAYSQIRLIAETAKQCNFNIVGGQATGTYRFLTGFYGLADIPAELQKAMDRTLNQFKNTFCFLDDILIVSKGKATDHEKLVRDVLQKLNDENLALKITKCEFFQPSVNWLGHNLSAEGIIPKITKTEAISNLQPPKSLKQFRSFMGSINHLSKFIPNAASLTDKLRPLLKEENEKKK